MTRTLALTVTLVLLGFAGLQPAYVTSGQADWKTILDGTTLKGWDVVGNANWSVADGAVQASSGTGFLVTPMSYTDFQITADFWVTDDANSGIFIRLQDPKTIAANNSYEVNIFDKRPDQTYRTGGIVDVAKPMAMVNTGGKWNTIDITARGTQADRADQRHEDGGHGRQEIRARTDRAAVRRRHGEVQERPAEDAVARSSHARASASLEDLGRLRARHAVAAVDHEERHAAHAKRPCLADVGLDGGRHTRHVPARRGPRFRRGPPLPPARRASPARRPIAAR